MQNILILIILTRLYYTWYWPIHGANSWRLLKTAHSVQCSVQNVEGEVKNHNAGHGWSTSISTVGYKLKLVAYRSQTGLWWTDNGLWTIDYRLKYMTRPHSSTHRQDPRLKDYYIYNYIYILSYRYIDWLFAMKHNDTICQDKTSRKLNKTNM